MVKMSQKRGFNKLTQRQKETFNKFKRILDSLVRRGGRQEERSKIAEELNQIRYEMVQIIDNIFIKTEIEKEVLFDLIAERLKS